MFHSSGSLALGRPSTQKSTASGAIAKEISDSSETKARAQQVLVMTGAIWVSPTHLLQRPKRLADVDNDVPHRRTGRDWLR